MPTTRQTYLRGPAPHPVISTSLLLALGLEERLVGIEAKDDSHRIYQLSAPQVIDLPSVSIANEFDPEGYAALEPDLIILPVVFQSVIPSLEELGFTVIVVNPEDKALLEEAVTLLGMATNTTARAEELLAFHYNHLSLLTEALDGTDVPSVYLAGNSAFLSVAGSLMYQNSLIEQAGGSNAAADITEDYWADISYEQLLAWNPDYIILTADAEYTVESVLEDKISRTAPLWKTETCISSLMLLKLGTALSQAAYWAVCGLPASSIPIAI